MNNGLLYGALGLGGLITTYFLYKKVSSDMKQIFGSSSDEEIERNREALKKVKIDYSKKFSLGNSKAEINAKAGAFAKVLYQNMKGKSNFKNYAIIKEIFKRLRYKNDVRIVFKKFGLRDGETLEDWIMGENMPERDKSLILTKIGMAI